MNRPEWLGVIVALLIGVIVRWLRLPIPAPPTIYGSLMVLATTVGYLLMDRLLKK